MAFVQIYMLFDRACSTNDVDLFAYALKQMIDEHGHITHPGVPNLLARGVFSIQRRSENFSRSPVDITLGQIVNRDSASRHTGIAAFTDSIKARKLWTITRSTHGTRREAARDGWFGKYCVSVTRIKTFGIIVV